jgi:large subunit ribosomal protein L3
MNTFYAIKKDQTHTYNKNGKRIFITRLISNPLIISQIKNLEKDGLNSVQIAIGSKKRVSKPLAGHLKKANITPRYIREIKLQESTNLKVSDQILATQVLEVGDIVDIRSKTKGRGFTGVMKRWRFHGGPATHGQSDRPRSPGSIGQGTDPGRVWKGKKMAGRKGGKYLTARGGQVVYINNDSSELWVTGSIPGFKGCLVQLDKVDHKDFPGFLENPSQEATNKEENQK